MKIATDNVNYIGARLPVLLHWLASSKPDVACPQDLETTDEATIRESEELAA